MIKHKSVKHYEGLLLFTFHAILRNVFNEAFRGLWVIYWESLQWQSAVSAAAVRQLKIQITLNQHHLQAQVNLRANNDERNLFKQLSPW